MRRSLLLMIITACLAAAGNILSGQDGSDVPKSPLLTLVSVNYQTGAVHLTWEPGGSPDVAGYVVYYYIGDSGFFVDTLPDPMAVSFTYPLSGAVSRSESYVVAAFDMSGNISPLSNDLSTIYTVADLDTCAGTITIAWNGYKSYPREVTGYSLLMSVDNGSLIEAASSEPGDLSLVIDDFTVDSDYCFVVRANLEGGFVSYSNMACINTKMQRAPGWINADYATVNGSGGIDLSFTVDPMSEIRLFRLEKSSQRNSGFRQIALITSPDGSVKYTDSQADITRVNYYRLAAVNNCNNPLATSNLCSNIVLDLYMSDYDIKLNWNAYREWLGNISGYTLYINTGSGFTEKEILLPSDTSFTIAYSDVMQSVEAGEICFMVSASESGNPLSGNGESRSNRACAEAIENITVPNLFTPDGDNINDLFRPVLSFTPSSYHLIVSDRNGRQLFETRDHTESWDGSHGGRIMPQGAYLWFLRVTTPAGKAVSRSGTITIYRSR